MSRPPSSPQRLTVATVPEFVEDFTRYQADETLWTVGDVREALTKALVLALNVGEMPEPKQAPERKSRAELLAMGVPKHTVDALYPSALQAMVAKVDNRGSDQRGYVTTRDEVIAILSEVSKLVPASIVERRIPDSMGPDCVAVDITFGLTLERSEL